RAAARGLCQAGRRPARTTTPQPVCSAGFRMETWRSLERLPSWTFMAILLHSAHCQGIPNASTHPRSRPHSKRPRTRREEYDEINPAAGAQHRFSHAGKPLSGQFARMALHAESELDPSPGPSERVSRGEFDDL